MFKTTHLFARCKITWKPEKIIVYFVWGTQEELIYGKLETLTTF